MTKSNRRTDSIAKIFTWKAVFRYSTMVQISRETNIHQLFFMDCAMFVQTYPSRKIRRYVGGPEYCKKDDERQFSTSIQFTIPWNVPNTFEIQSNSI